MNEQFAAASVWHDRWPNTYNITYKLFFTILTRNRRSGRGRSQIGIFYHFSKKLEIIFKYF